jgi:hypothetical protein
MNTMKCPECNREFSHENPQRLKIIVARHRSMEHEVYGKAKAKKMLQSSHPDTVQVDREKLQTTSWWQTPSDKRPIICPCCAARFIIVEGSKV